MSRHQRAPGAPRPVNVDGDEQPQAAADRVAALPGWLLLAGGLALVALAVLTPQWMENQRLAWQRTVLEAQTRHLTDQAQRYAELHEALAEGDPVLLERVAFVELGLKPRGKQPLLPSPETAPDPVRTNHFASMRESGGAGGSPPAPDPEAAALMAVQHQRKNMRTVSDWPVRPLPRVGRELPGYQPPDTRLTRLTRGQSRLGLIAAGLLCLVAACYPGAWERGVESA